MWPAPVIGDVDPEWVKLGQEKNGVNDTTRPGGSGARYPAGWYLLHTDFANLAGAIAMPGSETWNSAAVSGEATELSSAICCCVSTPPATSGRSFPLLMAVGTTKEAATRSALEDRLRT